MKRARRETGRYYVMCEKVLASGIAASTKCCDLRHNTDKKYVFTDDISMPRDNHLNFITHVTF